MTRSPAWLGKLTGRGVAGLALLAALSRGVAGQEAPVGTWRAVSNPLAGWHFLGPVMASVSATAGVGTGNLNIPEPGSRFVLAIAEPWIGGGRLSLAYAHWLGFQGGVIARATALRYWSGPPDRSYYGAEAQFVISVLPIGVRIGGFRPTNDRAGPRKTLWLADLSLMY